MIHVPTLTATMVVSFAILVLALSVIWNGPLRHQVGLRSVLFGSVAVLSALLLFSLRPFMPERASILCANASMLAGLMFYVRAAYLFVRGRPQPNWQLGAGCAVLLLVALTLDWPLQRRVTAYSFAYALILLPACRLLLWKGRSMELSLRTAGIAMLVCAVSLVLRSANSLARAGAVPEPSAAGFGEAATMLVGIVALVGVGFGFVLAGLERVAVRMEELATRDALTGCFNRHTADTLMEHALRRGQREGTPVCYVVMDLDHFKQINDRHGHRAGDDALRQFAATVRTRLRRGDIFARLGGEEFSVVLPSTDAAGAIHLAEAIRRAVAALRLIDAEGRPYAMTVSAGIALAASDEVAATGRLYARADDALYRAKAEGRNRVVVAAD